MRATLPMFLAIAAAGIFRPIAVSADDAPPGSVTVIRSIVTTKTWPVLVTTPGTVPTSYMDVIHPKVDSNERPLHRVSRYDVQRWTKTQDGTTTFHQQIIRKTDLLEPGQ